jgi:TRAP-type C4-dicarboxylate transport system permease small subunit
MLSRISRNIVQGAGYLAGVATFLILVLVCVEVVARLFGTSIMVADEFAGYLNAAIIFLGLGYALKEGAFIRVEIVYDRMKGKWLAAVQWIIVLSSLAFAAILTYFMASHTQYAIEQDIRAVSLLQTPEWIPMIVVSIGCAILVLQLVMFVVTRFKNLP